MKNDSKLSIFTRGMRDGLPIGAGYFTVAFSLGIAAQRSGMHPLQGFIMSFLNHASAGEYAGISAILSNATYLETALLILVANARYLLMSCALSQKLSPDMPFYQRFITGFFITDELFGLGISYPGYLEPIYYYGAILTTVPFWASATAIGIKTGDILPPIASKALSAAIYGMFIAIIIPPAKKNRVIALTVVAGFLVSYLFSVIPAIAVIPEGTRVIIITLLISVIAALLAPLPDESEMTA